MSPVLHQTLTALDLWQLPAGGMRRELVRGEVIEAMMESLAPTGWPMSSSSPISYRSSYAGLPSCSSDCGSAYEP